jgi:ABC-2 type transport system ATP-binding protein
MSIVRIGQLSHSYNGGRTWAVKDVSFEINAKGIVGLLGSNGAGKSTTMNIMTGVLNQTQGAVEINGWDIRTHAEEAKRQLGFLPQSPPLYLDLTVDEYLQHCAKLRLMEKKSIRNAMEEVKEKVNITHFSKRLLKNLSGGYRQRVGIAQAIIHRPQLVVMDEPTVGLDPNQIVELRNLVKEIAQDRAVIFSTHIMSEVDLMCRDVLMIEHGKLVFSGSLEEFRKIETPGAVLATMDVPPTKEELLSIVGVERVEFMTPKRIRFYINGEPGVTERIISQSEMKGWRLQEIMYEQKTLESIFSKMSGRVQS